MAAILIVDDHFSIRSTLYDLFLTKHHCRTAATACEALARLNTEEFDVVILDISLPDMSGLEIVGRIRLKQPGTPVIIISAINFHEYSGELIKMGAFDYLLKPFDLEQIEESVGRALASRVEAPGGETSSAGALNPPEPGPGDAHGDRDGARVLVIDDAPDVAETIAVLLRIAGYTPISAFSAADALDAASAGHFEAILSDIGMPGMNGYELARKLRAMPQYSAVPMISMTGFAQYDDRLKALGAGFDAHITKPINPVVLVEMMRDLRSRLLPGGP